MSTPAAKTCAKCGRSFSWRKKWARTWEEVRYCSARCRKTKLNQVDKELEQAILQLLNKRRQGATICPSEAARAVASDGWRLLMERSRQAARRLVEQKKIEITQGGHVVDPSTTKGPIRLRRS